MHFPSTFPPRPCTLCKFFIQNYAITLEMEQSLRNPHNYAFHLSFQWKLKPHNPFNKTCDPSTEIIFYFHLFRLLFTALSINQSKTDYFQTQTTFYSKTLETTQKLNLFPTSSNRKSMKLFTFFPFCFRRQFFISFFSFPIFFGFFFG